MKKYTHANIKLAVVENYKCINFFHEFVNLRKFPIIFV